LSLLTLGGGPSFLLSCGYPGPAFRANVMLPRHSGLTGCGLRAPAQLTLEVGDFGFDTIQFLLISNQGGLKYIGV
jgi:hypothetical protein